jgi:transcriptional regulator with XRE-family HTH domain
MEKSIHKAREEAGYNQRELANFINRRQAALSVIENGLMQPDAETLLGLSYNLNKSINYFFPAPYKPDPQPGEYSEKEIELIMQTRRLSEDDLKKIIAQVRALADLLDGK